MALRHADFEFDWIFLNINALFFSKSISTTFFFIMLVPNLIAVAILLLLGNKDSQLFKKQYQWIH